MTAWDETLSFHDDALDPIKMPVELYLSPSGENIRKVTLLVEGMYQMEPAASLTIFPTGLEVMPIGLIETHTWSCSIVIWKAANYPEQGPGDYNARRVNWR